MIALYGGSFDPVHIGHLRIAEDIREYFSLHKIIFVPAYHSPLKPESRASPQDRVNMLNLSIRYNKHFDISLYEIEKKGKSYTVDTAEYFFKKLDYHPAFIVGTDAFLSLKKWKEPYKLLKILNFIVVLRQNSKPEDIESFIKENFPYVQVIKDKQKIDPKKTAVYIFKSRRLDISSTEIRDRIKHNKPITYLVLPEVEYYIIKKNLYRE